MHYDHRPVLLNEVLEGLAIKPNGIYIDGTFGRGGHSLAILKGLGPEGRLLAMDKDPIAVAEGSKGPFLDKRFTIIQCSFAELRNVVAKQGWLGMIDGILLDLGVSSPQLDDASRGFSFLKEGPLNMRMNPQQGLDAETWINRAKEQEIAQVLWEYGEERFSRRIARLIVMERHEQRITTTTQLAAIIERAVPRREPKKHPATRSFQAIRIFINNELEELKATLNQTLDVLKVGARLCVISFHSLEDRIVKQFIQKMSQRGGDMFGQDLTSVLHMKRIGKLIRPQYEEEKQNPRARSARLRIAEKIA